jgi:hypothetical protein
MNINQLRQTLENKVLALEQKKEAAYKKGAVELALMFENQLTDAIVTLSFVNRAVEGGFTKAEKDAIEQNIINHLPKLTWYFRKDSIENAVRNSIKKAFKEVI